MIAALLLLFAQAPPQLTPQSLVAHPGLLEGQYTAVREQHLSALEAEPTSPWAYAAVQAISLLGPLCSEGLAPDRLTDLANRIEDGYAQHSVVQLLEEEVDRRRFSETPVVLQADLRSDFLDQWFLLGPYGRLDEPEPLWGDVDMEAPHHTLREEYQSVAGQPLRWKPIRRPRNTLGILPELDIDPSGGGTAYMLSWIEAPVEEALLEIWSERAIQVYWNGALVHEQLRVGLTRSNERITVPVRLAPGSNGLLLRFECGADSVIGARLLQPDGKLLVPAATTSDDSAVRTFPSTEPLGRTASQPSTDPYASCIEMLVAISNNRCDRALAIEEPDAPEVLPAWLRLRYHAVRSSHHLPAEVDRRFQQDIEARLEELGVRYPEIEMFRAYRLLAEDQPHAALEISNQLVEAYPRVPLFRLQRMGTLSEIDKAHIESRKAARETLEILDDPDAWSALATEATQRGDTAAALGFLEHAAKADGRNEHPRVLLQGLANGTEPQLERALQLIENWRAGNPFAVWLDDAEVDVLTRLHRTDEVRGLLLERTMAHPLNPSNWTRLADHYLTEGQDEAARAALERVIELSPDNYWAHGALEQLGELDPAEKFFREFAPDRAAALAAASATPAPDCLVGASTALILDSRLVYVRPDNSTRNRTHQISLALDRTGTEILHEQPDSGETRVMRVLGADGKMFEPVLVDDSWVMPSLDPGDAVEHVFDESYSGYVAAAPQLGVWWFESFDQPFLVSRYVVYLPDGTPGRWELSSFQGTHDEILWAEGVVHIFEMRDRPQLEQEPAQPSPREILSWVEYGEDLRTRFAAQSIAASQAWQQDVADDVAIELRELVEQTSREHTRDELPRALYNAVTEHVIDFGGSGDTTDVWYLERGNPIGLLAALFEIADIPYEWAIPFPYAAPELDPDPKRAFLTGGEFGQPWLRIEEEQGEPTYLLIPNGGRGLPYGLVPEDSGGTRFLVFHQEGTSFETLPPTSEDRWQNELELDIYLQEDNSARVAAHFRMADAAGPLTRETVTQLEPEQREQGLRQLATRLVPGIDIESIEVPHMRERGANLELVFEGTLKRFVRGASNAPYCKLTWQQQQLGRLTGEGEREWPLALRIHRTDRVTIRIHASETWGIGKPPESKSANREGIRYEVFFQAEDGLLTASRDLRIHGLELQPEELAEFAREVKELEDIDSARIPLIAKN